MFNKVDPKQSFPDLEQRILKIWNKNNTFQESINIRKDNPEFVFYDGPPFATGLPHYGHILAGTLKDVIPRYKTMRGYRVERKFGWDCHGLPVENLIEKELSLDDKKVLEKYGIGKFNEDCRASVLRYVNEWKQVVNRMGRWVDFENSYKTMDIDYMESTWWVFSELWNKEMVYQGHKPMHICPRCVTALSNFEVNVGYKDLTDLTVTAKFKINRQCGLAHHSNNKSDTVVQSKNKSLEKCGGQSCIPSECTVYFLAWTTTPWTLLGNVALAVGENIEYSLMRKGNEVVVIATECLKNYEKELEGYECIGTKTGKHFAEKGLTYEPIFHFFKEEENNGGFRIVVGDFVTTESGSGIVHTAPAFGEDDMKLGKKEKLPFIQHVTMDGHFVHKIHGFPNEPVKNKKDNMRMDRSIVELLEDEGKVFQKKTIRHSYPTCWRCETPLLNYATKSWFIKVEDIKEKLLKNNKKITWIPEHIKNGRFGKWLENSRDWAVSRTRYWGTPLPIWENDKTGKFKCISSVKELEDLTGKKITDLHKHFVDKLTFRLPGEDGTYKRIEEVFDCWFESGAMPYASKHYPFSEKITLNNEFYISRHGEAEHNVNHLISCKVETSKKYPLTKKGKEDVTNYAKELGVKFDYIFTSPLLRTMQTAEIYKKYCSGEIIQDERIIEHQLINYDEKPVEDWNIWKRQNDVWNNRFHGGENFIEEEKRFLEFLEEINTKYKGKNILIVSHASGIRRLNDYVKGTKTNEDCGVTKGKAFKLETSFKFPADFIAEGIDQTRGWFYTLHVLSTGIFGKPAFENVIVNGIVLAEDGEKMSKSKKNYPDPSLIFDKYGADAMRFYLMNSPVVEAEDFRFSERGVEEVVKSILLPLWNSYSFFVMYANIDGINLGKNSTKKNQGDNLKLTELDRWMLSELEIMIKNVTESMDTYKLNYATKHFSKFIDNITNWYIRRSRKRFWSKAGGKDQKDKEIAYAVLHKVLTETCKLLSPFCPFITEEIYQNLSNDTKSIHHELWPEITSNFIDKKLSEKIAITQEIISLGLSLRKKLGIKVRQPLSYVEIALNKNINLKDQFDTIKEELNVKEIKILKDAQEIAEIRVSPNAKILGPKFGAKVQEIIREAKEGKYKKLPNGNLQVCGEELTKDEIEIGYVGKNGKEVASENGIVVYLNPDITENLRLEGIARDIIRQVAEMRKEALFEITDRIKLEISDKEVEKHFGKMINTETLSEFTQINKVDKEGEIEGVKIKIKKLI